MWRGAIGEGWGWKKIFTDEHLEANDKAFTDCGFYLLYKEGIAKSEWLGIEYLREIEKVEVFIKKKEGMH